MAAFETVKTDAFMENPFTLIGKQWMLITAEKDGKVNTMTASWGGLGEIWGQSAAYIVVRPQRYTKEFWMRRILFPWHSLRKATEKP